MVALNILVTVAHPWKSRHRTAFIALIALIALISVSTFIFFVAYPLAPLALRRADDSRPRVPLLATSRRFKAAPSPPPKDQVHLNPDQELAAVSSFLASLPQNVIPPSVDPLQPIDPQLVLDFDTRSPRAKAEVQVMVDDVWARNPIVLYSKVCSLTSPTLFRVLKPSFHQLYSPKSREIKALLADMHLNPVPTIFDVDKRGSLSLSLTFTLECSTQLYR
jgi:hypothetical protein